jgi:hypothetical protein
MTLWSKHVVEKKVKVHIACLGNSRKSLFIYNKTGHKLDDLELVRDK